MGKKSKEQIPAPSDAIRSLFSADNPFRRKTQPNPDPNPNSTPPDLGLGFHPTLDKTLANPNDDQEEPRKRKRNDVPNPNPTSDSIPKKRKKLESGGDDDEESPKKKRKKRKRDELEEEYEKSKYGAAGKKEEGENGAVVAVGNKRKAADAAASSEMVASKEEEGFDDESKLLRTVFVGNLPLKIKKKTILKEFERFGEIDSVRIRSVPLVDSKTPRKGAVIKGEVNEAVGRVHAYIVFNDEQSARAALSHNMAEVRGNHIRVDMACPPRKKMKGEPPLYERKKTVFVGNLPFDVKDEELYQLFCGSVQSGSSVEAVRVVRDPQTSMGKGIAYVLFKTRDAANSIVKRRDLKIRDRDLRLCHAKSDATPVKRKEFGAKREPTRKKFAATSYDPSSGKNSKPKASAASLSYQGLRSSKSGVVKKSGLHSQSGGHVVKKSGFHSQSGGHDNRGIKREGPPDKKAHKNKRPAVAARKAKLLRKRKMEGGTPENSHLSKKARRQ